jgi:hypothetical protein
MISAPNKSFPKRERNLLNVVKQISKQNNSKINLTARLLLGEEEHKTHPIYNSKLNNDGSPLQLCITSTNKVQSLKILCDPRSDITNLNLRHGYALHVLRELMKTPPYSSLKDVVDCTLECNLPHDITKYPSLEGGTLWLGVPIGTEGLAVYLNGRWGTPAQQWERVNRWLDKLIPIHESRIKALSKLSKFAVIASVGLEGIDENRLRYKIYFRLTDAYNLNRLDIDLLSSESLLTFLELALSDHEIPSAGMVFCIGLCALTGEIVDAKIDLCGHCLAPIVDNWLNLLETLTSRINIPLNNTLKLAAFEQFAEIAFLGCGVKTDGSVRLNLYLKGRE